VTLPRQWQRHALALVEQATPLEGEFFRSVELAYAHPDDVVSGEGTRSYGGRFVRPGLRAVYGSVDEETAFRESAARMNRLAGRGGARVVGYPRITYVIGVKAASHVALTTTRSFATLSPSRSSSSSIENRSSRSFGILHTVWNNSEPFPNGSPHKKKTRQDSARGPRHAVGQLKPRTKRAGRVRDWRRMAGRTGADVIVKLRFADVTRLTSRGLAPLSRRILQIHGRLHFTSASAHRCP
jgi:RES domain-containing protein